MQHSGLRIGQPRKDQHISRDIPRSFRPHTAIGFSELIVPGEQPYLTPLSPIKDP